MINTQNSNNTSIPFTIEDIAKVVQDTMLQNQVHYEGENILATSFIENWIEEKYHTGNITQKTYENYEGRYKNHIKPYIQDITLTQITVTKVNEIIAILVNKKSVSNATVCDIIRVLSMALNDAFYQEYIPKNPCANKAIKLPKIRNKKEQPAYTLEEIQVLYNTNKEHYNSIAIPLLACTGIRKGELLALTWEHLIHNGDTWYIKINQKVSATKQAKIDNFTKTLDGVRCIPIDNNLAYTLLYHKEHVQHNKKTYIISQQRNDKSVNPRNFYRTFLAWRQKAHIRKELTVHSFRRTFATQLILNHTESQIIKAWGGWRDDKMITRYANDAQIIDARQKEVVSKMGTTFRGLFN